MDGYPVVKHGSESNGSYRVGRSAGPPDRFPHHGADLRQGGRIQRPLRSGTVPHRAHQQRAVLSAAASRSARRGADGAAAPGNCSAWAARRWIPATPSCARWSGTAARPRISTPPPITARWSAHGQQWVEVENQRMDALDRGGRRPRRLPPAARHPRRAIRWWSGMRGIRVVPESKERDRLAFAFMSNGISSERQVETAVRQTAALMRQTHRAEAEGRRGGGARGGPYRRRRARLPN